MANTSYQQLMVTAH